MPKHHSGDYKIAAIKHYLYKTNNLTQTCKEFQCSRISLKRWIEKYKETGQIKRNNRKPVSYKITKKQVEYAIQKLKDNQQNTMKELAKIIKKKYKTFDVTPQHLGKVIRGKVIRDNNKTRKRTRHEHFPSKRYGKDINKKKELNKFYKEVEKYNLNKIISIDETSITPAMLYEYSRCSIGKRCVFKTSDNAFFTKFTLVAAISNSKCIGWKLYEKEV